MNSERDNSESEIIEQKIADYLTGNPDYFSRHAELLENLQLDHEVNGSVSLVEKQLIKLREKEQKMQTQLHQMLEAATNNSGLLEKTSALTVSLIKARSAQEMFDHMQSHLSDAFEIDSCEIWLFDDTGTLNNVNYGDLETIRQLTEQKFINEDPVCGRVTDSTVQLFGGDSRIQSYAMIPLGYGARKGLIVLGSKNVNLFTADMGTLFLRLIGDVSEACLDKHDS